MKIRTSVNLFLTLILVIVVFGALTSTIYYTRSFIEIFWTLPFRSCKEILKAV